MTEEYALKILAEVTDSGSGKSLIELGWLSQIRINPPRAIVRLGLPNFAQSQRSRIVDEIRSKLTSLEEITDVQIELDTSNDNTKKPSTEEIPQKQSIDGVKRVIAISSGKGGVGKSTVAVNLACALSSIGHKVGLLDADIYGPNTPLMLGVNNDSPKVYGSGEDQRLVPIQKHGISLVSMGFLIEEAQPVIWRGPMLNGIIRQFLYQVEWGQLDYLIVDLPPGTGDAQISLAQAVPMAGVIIVTTPQKVSLQDSRRGLSMFKQLNVPILGVVENMSGFIPPEQPEKKYDIFGSGGGLQLAKENNVCLLSQIPIELPIVEDSNNGIPIVRSKNLSKSAEQFINLAEIIAKQLS
tara:strand:+ start:8150 stop:9208 length:1059 start_codon:yes stop_codon:yes gene_type:complete